MKRTALALIALVLALALAACGGKSALEKATGASAEQAAAMEQVLLGAGVACHTARRLEMDDTPEGYELYEIISKEGAEYRMLVDGGTGEVALVIDVAGGSALYGSLTEFLGGTDH